MYVESIPIPVGEYTAELEIILFENSLQFRVGEKRPLVLICPGGGYRFLADDECNPMTTQFLAAGYHAAVLHYSAAPARFPVQLLQLALAVKKLREMADTHFIDADRIAVAGFSAGGHLAASLGVFWNTQTVQEVLKTECRAAKPNLLLLGYPVISTDYAHVGSFQNLLGEDWKEKAGSVSLEKYVSTDTPPTFLWYTFEDKTVPYMNSMLFAQALGEHGVPFELHIFQPGRHGLCLANRQAGYDVPACTVWVQMAVNWLNDQFRY